MILRLILLLVIPMNLYGQNNIRLGIVSCYDYNIAIDLGANLMTNEKQDTLYYCQVNYNQGATTIDLKESFSSMATFEEKKNILLYVHGDGANITELIERGNQLPQLYNTNTLFFAWPSLQYDENRIRNYQLSKKMVPKCFDRFLQTIDSLQLYARQNNAKCSLFFHSLGNHFAKQLAHYIITNPNKKYLFDNIILNAPCVWEQDHYFWVDILQTICKGDVIVTHNQKDRVLKTAAIYMEQQPLMGRLESWKFMGKRAKYVDFTNALDYIDTDARFITSHTYFLEEPPLQNHHIKDFFYNTCNGIPLSVSIFTGLATSSRSNTFYILP